MKKITFISLLLFLFAFAGQSQKIYSVENLEQASQEDLNIYLEKSQKLKKTGGFLSIAGPSSFITGAVLFSAGWNNEWDEDIMYVLYFMALGGIGATIVGLPILITGSSRVKKINTIKNTAYDGIKIDLKPCAQYNLATHNYQPGVTLRIRF